MGIKQKLPPTFKSQITIQLGTPYVPPKPTHKVHYIPKDCLYHDNYEGKYDEGYCSKTITEEGDVQHHELRCQRNFGFCPDYIPKYIQVYHLKGSYSDMFGIANVDSYFLSKEELDEEYNLYHQINTKVKLKITKEILPYNDVQQVCKNTAEYVKRNLDFFDKKARAAYYKKEVEDEARRIKRGINK